MDNQYSQELLDIFEKYPHYKVFPLIYSIKHILKTYKEDPSDLCYLCFMNYIDLSEDNNSNDMHMIVVNNIDKNEYDERRTLCNDCTTIYTEHEISELVQRILNESYYNYRGDENFNKFIKIFEKYVSNPYDKLLQDILSYTKEYYLHRDEISKQLPPDIDIINKLKKIYFETDDKEDIFKELNNENISDTDIGDNYICYSRFGEYGHTIKLGDLDGICICEILVANTLDENGINYITTFYCHSEGIFEEIYSNRTEYTVNGVFYSSKLDDKLMMDIYKANTKMIMYDMIFPSLYKFITSILESQEDDITLIPKSEFLD